jgi:hypothetical protein
MTFRQPFPASPKDKNGAGGSVVPRRPEPTKEKTNVDRDPTLPNQADLAEMRDNGQLSQAAMWAEVIRIGETIVAEKQPDPTISHEEGSAVASALLDVDAAIRRAALALKIEGNLDVHPIFEGMLKGCAEAGARVADRWES